MIRFASKLVPPTSIDNNLFFSIILAKFSAPETPPAGPEKIVEIGFASAI